MRLSLLGFIAITTVDRVFALGRKIKTAKQKEKPK